MKKNLAQVIERYLLDLLTESHDQSLEIRRIELAEELGCAPSQITYVLGTRFTSGQGYSVESRRGNGGFIRITRAQSAENYRSEVENSFIKSNYFDEKLTFEEVEKLLPVLWRAGLVSKREAELLHLMMQVVSRWIPRSEQHLIALELLKTATRSEKG
jgi:Transcriptional repressor of class III stress genes